MATSPNRRGSPSNCCLNNTIDKWTLASTYFVISVPISDAYRTMIYGCDLFLNVINFEMNVASTSTRLESANHISNNNICIHSVPKHCIQKRSQIPNFFRFKMKKEQLINAHLIDHHLNNLTVRNPIVIESLGITATMLLRRVVVNILRIVVINITKIDGFFNIIIWHSSHGVGIHAMT